MDARSAINLFLGEQSAPTEEETKSRVGDFHTRLEQNYPLLPLPSFTTALKPPRCQGALMRGRGVDKYVTQHQQRELLYMARVLLITEAPDPDAWWFYHARPDGEIPPERPQVFEVKTPTYLCDQCYVLPSLCSATLDQKDDSVKGRDPPRLDEFRGNNVEVLAETLVYEIANRRTFCRFVFPRGLFGRRFTTLARLQRRVETFFKALAQIKIIFPRMTPTEQGQTAKSLALCLRSHGKAV